MGSLFTSYAGQVANPALRYYGAKFRLAGWISGCFPPGIDCYVEVFGGAAGVLLRKKRHAIEVYNDLDGGVVNFFRVLRDSPGLLHHALRLTPFAREEYDAAFEVSPDPVEDARRFFVVAWQGFGASRNKKSGWKNQKEKWERSRANQIAEWQTAVRNITKVAARFQNVQIERCPALEVIQRYDSPKTLFYVDPPYPERVRNRRWAKVAYAHEFAPDDHTHMANLLHRIKGKAIVSSYAGAGYEELYAGWHTESKTAQTMNKTVATEWLWMNFTPEGREHVASEPGAAGQSDDLFAVTNKYE